MALRIACDLDGTLADMESALQREAERLFGADVDLRARDAVVPDSADDEDANPPTLTPEQPVNLNVDSASVGRRPLTDRQMRQLWRHVRRLDNFWMTLEEIEPGAVGRLAALASLHGWDVIFLTQRPPTAGDTAQTQSQRWLAAHGFEFPSVYVMSGSRGKVADALRLDAVIDDRPENCLDVAADSKARPVLISRREAASAPPGASSLGITVVHSFAEALEILLQLMAQRSNTRSLVSRVRAAIGI
jgi:hypothetical protein